MSTIQASRIVTVTGTEIETVKATMTEKQRKRLMMVISPIVLLVIWELLVRIGVLNAMFFPAPSTIVQAYIKAIATGQIAIDLKSSMLRVILGFFAGAVPGVILGLSMGLFPIVRAIFEPIVATLYPIPKLALMPLIMLIFGLGEKEKVIVIMLGVIFPVVINTAAGVLNLDKRYMDVAKNFGASKFNYYCTVAIPGSLSMIFTGLRLGIGMAVLLLVAAEMHGASAGIGYRIWTSYDLFDITTMFVSFGLLALLGYIATVLVDEVEVRLIPWKQR
ncbi:ABC transporter permease [Fodinisporobacter ferrooxydans]|uniref:ABC transporter permease n=1 Tax=Fodinisporobacter ferrooxydans TaxID=2901836 RepID=A0ABY4CIP2_9BACL|nr:ABC transporter permease [Alicyclobacillaceae bacterium MYW30-H2]